MTVSGPTDPVVVGAGPPVVADAVAADVALCAAAGKAAAKAARATRRDFARRAMVELKSKDAGMEEG